mgnify:CR=1 FL=1
MTVPQRVLDTMNSGLIYTCDDEEMIKAQKEQMELLYDFNATRPSQMTQRNEIARQLLGEFGEDAYIGTAVTCQLGIQHVFQCARLRQFQPYVS